MLRRLHYFRNQFEILRSEKVSEDADDIVIEDRQVAKIYQKAMKELQMTILKEKSLINDHGCLEFAKLFLIKKGRVNISPVSVPMVRALVHSLSVAPAMSKDRERRSLL
ncbi:conserved hypothetical protein [Ricinus communis]|uniref:Uncharacterized protein n=1 Tax=Ricinus communis TaxID=3988 RepID=B9T1A7_RICCO|nr:conserved hypothetical protein [Ricinus communis]